MKKLIFLLLGILTIGFVDAQDIRPDTSIRAGRTDAYRWGIIGSQPYIIPPTGNTVQALVFNNLFQSFYTGGDTGAQYFLISTSTLDNSNGSLFDAYHITATVGGWNGDNREVIDLYLASRATFYYNWISRGTHQTTEGIVVYQNANNTFSVYGVLTGNFKFGSVSVNLNNQWKQLPLNVLGSKSASTPSGTLVFDSRNTATYPPVTLGGSGGSTGVSTANNQTGTTYTLVSTDCGKTIIFNNASAITCTVPASILTANCYVQWKQKGAGQVTFSAGAGLTLNLWQTYSKSGGQNAMGTIYYDSTTEATLGGQMSN